MSNTDKTSGSFEPYFLNASSSVITIRNEMFPRHYTACNLRAMIKELQPYEIYLRFLDGDLTDALKDDTIMFTLDKTVSGGWWIYDEKTHMDRDESQNSLNEIVKILQKYMRVFNITHLRLFEIFITDGFIENNLAVMITQDRHRVYRFDDFENYMLQNIATDGEKSEPA